MSKVSNKILSRTYVLMAFFSLFALAIVVQLVRLKFFEASYWQAAAERETIIERQVEAMRGNILADDGSSMLATSMPLYRCSIDPSRVALNPDLPADRDTLLALCDSLALVFGKQGEYDRQFFWNRIVPTIRNAKADTVLHAYVLNQKLQYKQYQRMKKWPLLRNHPMKGGLLGEREANRRGEPFGDLASFTLGRWNDKGKPVKGLENWFDEELRGQHGTILVRKIVGKAEQPLFDYGEAPARDGNDIVTTLNVQMQDIVAAALDSTLRKHKARYGTAVLMEVQTGHVKAVANLGRHGDSYIEDFNYGIAQRIEPGSTFKLASAIIALEDNAIGLRDPFDTQEGIRQFYDREMRDERPRGKIDMFEAFRVSSNVYFSSIIYDHYKNKPRRFIEYIERLGLTQAVASQVKGEPAPYLIEPGNELWVPNTLPWMAIGYNLELTPLQICTFYNSIANDGKVMAPLLVSEVRDGPQALKKFEPKILNQQVAAPWVIQEVKKMMELVVEEGTAKRIRTDEYKIAGKTGTAKKLKNGVYVNDYQASFAGYFPADHPKYTLYVLIDEPTEGSFYGGAVAAPAFREIADKIYALDLSLSTKTPGMGLAAQAAEPEVKTFYGPSARAFYQSIGKETPSELPANWIQPRSRDGRINFEKIEIKKGEIPSVVGMSARDALNLMEYVGQPVNLIGHGKVSRQPISVGSPVQGEPLNLVLK